MKPRGFTIPEVLTYMLILGIVMSFIAGIFVAGIRYYHAGATNVEVQESNLKGAARLTKEIRESTTASVAYNAIGLAPNRVTTAIIFLSARNPLCNEQFDFNTTTGAPQWHYWVAYYLKRQDDVNPVISAAQGPFKLIRKQFYNAPPFSLITLPTNCTTTGGWSTIPAGNPPAGWEGIVRALPAGPGVEVVMISENITGWYVTPDPFVAGTKNFTISVTASKRTPIPQPGAQPLDNDLQVQEQVTLRN